MINTGNHSTPLYMYIIFMYQYRYGTSRHPVRTCSTCTCVHSCTRNYIHVESTHIHVPQALGRAGVESPCVCCDIFRFAHASILLRLLSCWMLHTPYLYACHTWLLHVCMYLCTNPGCLFCHSLQCRKFSICFATLTNKIRPQLNSNSNIFFYCSDVLYSF